MQETISILMGCVILAAFLSLCVTAVIEKICQWVKPSEEGSK